jgi:hypothetical protein
LFHLREFLVAHHNVNQHQNSICSSGAMYDSQSLARLLGGDGLMGSGAAWHSEAVNQLLPTAMTMAASKQTQNLTAAAADVKASSKEDVGGFYSPDEVNAETYAQVGGTLLAVQGVNRHWVIVKPTVARQLCNSVTVAEAVLHFETAAH